MRIDWLPLIANELSPTRTDSEKGHDTVAGVEVVVVPAVSVAVTSMRLARKEFQGFRCSAP